MIDVCIRRTLIAATLLNRRSCSEQADVGGDEVRVDSDGNSLCFRERGGEDEEHEEERWGGFAFHRTSGIGAGGKKLHKASRLFRSLVSVRSR